RRQVRVLRPAAVDDFSPVLVLPLQLESEMHLLRDNQAQGRVVNLEIAHPRRQLWMRGRCMAGQVLPIGLAIGDDLLDVYRRRSLIELEAMRIDDTDALFDAKPEFPVQRLCNRRAETAEEN